jgi:hypothetical protein
MLVTIYSSPVQITTDSPDRGAKSWRGKTGVWLAVVVGAVLITVGAVIGVGRWVADEPEAADSGAQSGPRKFGCVYEDREPDPDFCRREGADFARRAPVSDEQRQRAKSMVEMVVRAASSGGWCMGPITVACLQQKPSSHPPRPEDVDAARLWLARTGASDTTARLARRDDPAPVGSLLYTARVGDACIMGHVKVIPGSGSHLVAGLLPDGSCLSD